MIRPEVDSMTDRTKLQNIDAEADALRKIQSDATDWVQGLKQGDTFLGWGPEGAKRGYMYGTIEYGIWATTCSMELDKLVITTKAGNQPSSKGGSDTVILGITALSGVYMVRTGQDGGQLPIMYSDKNRFESTNMPCTGTVLIILNYYGNASGAVSIPSGGRLEIYAV
jgi:hypothetical protein